VHTSAKARLTSVTIWIRIRDPGRYQNLIICSLTHCQHSLKILCKFVRTFLRKAAHRQTDKRTNKRQLHILLGGVNKNYMNSAALGLFVLRPHRSTTYSTNMRSVSLCSHAIHRRIVWIPERSNLQWIRSLGRACQSVLFSPYNSAV